MDIKTDWPILVTGGAGGATLTAIFAWVRDNFTARRVVVAQRRIDYDLPITRGALDIGLSFKGEQHAKLYYHEVEVTNTSGDGVETTLWRLEFPKDATWKVLETVVTSEPPGLTFQVTATNNEWLELATGPLHPKDVVRIGFLCAGPIPSVLRYRGDPKIRRAIAAPLTGGVTVESKSEATKMKALQVFMIVLIAAFIALLGENKGLGVCFIIGAVLLRVLQWARPETTQV